MPETIQSCGDTSLRRLGALGALLCGACAVLGVVLLALEPTAANLVALLLALALAASGCAIARRA
ncbi:hypothetical protein [Thermophilibacter mediterraneus]|uniref:hypothetical protein n=1 Tax=Thermophilibacter mediterraneus TaxID=1871031 RepID=UPI0009307C92|nr:hypothetical protein [Thermophilibacter mediterraneus]